MKRTIYLAALLLFSCTPVPENEEQISVSVEDRTPQDTAPEEKTVEVVQDPKEESKPETPPLRIYANKRFREVTVERTGDYTFRVRGEAQVFEATFSWVIEDGHEQIKKGFEMTDAGAPAWGDFDFTVTARKKRPNSTLTLILFEASAMDGSPQHELPIVLY